MRHDKQPVSRLAITFVVVGLGLSAIGIAYMTYAGRPRELPPISAPASESGVEQNIEQLEALTRMMMHSFFLFLAFLFGSYLMVRIGRAVLSRRPARTRAAYVDAWSNYRLTQDEIDTASAQLDDDFPPDTPPRETDPRPSGD